MQLANKSPKVSWNACIVIAKTIKNECDDSPTKQMFFSENTVALLLDLVANKPNIKARIQAINALLNYTSIEQIGGPGSLPLAMDTIAACLHYKAHFAGSTAELNYLDTFEDGFLGLWVAVANMVREAKDEPVIHEFLNSNSTFNLL